ncbi:PIN domain-containing protein, partial [Burkholderia thailandensis]
FREVLDEESYDALLLALEKNALLLTLDGRLRELASVLGC